MKLILIHGRSQGGKDRDELQRLWEDALDQGFSNVGRTRPANLDIAFPYYGDTLDDLVAQLDAPLVADVVDRGAAADDREAAFRGEFLAELAAANAISEAQIRENYDGEVTDRGPLNWRWVRAVMKTLDQSQKLGELAIDQFTRDVYVYLTNAAVRRRLHALMTPHLTGAPCVVVGHSLGSVVAYDLLRATNHKVDRFVTLGSPLAVKAVKRRLQAPLIMPPSTTSWHNAYDPQDPVSLYPLDQDHFGIHPPITNYDGVDNDTGNQHGITGYLPDPWVAHAIHSALTLT